MQFIYNLAQKNNRILSDEQLKAIHHIQGPALTLAIPGSGKTTLMLYRAANIIHQTSINPNSLLNLTFSKAAANDMSIRYNKDILPYTGQKITISTIHSFCLSIIKAYSNHINKPIHLLKDYGKNSKSYILSSLYKNHSNKYITPEIFEELSRIISYKKNQYPPLDTTDKRNELPLKLVSNDLFHTLFFEYEKYKLQNNLIDFDDMLSHALAILNKYPKTVDYYHKKYKYIQIDEAQDTSSIQNHIISLIAGKSPNLFMVADDDQSIYQFRGASPSELLNFQAKYKNSKIYYLSKNFRCSPDIMRSCQMLIKNNQHRYDKQMQIDPSCNEPVIIRYFDSPEQRHNYIKQKITQSPTAILYRNHISSIPIIDYLNRNNCDFKIKDYGLTLSENKIVKDIFAFFQLALIRHDKESFFKIAYKLNTFIPKTALEFIRNYNLQNSVFQALKSIPNQSYKQIQNWTLLEDQFDKIKLSTPYDAIKIIETDLGYLKKLNTQCSKLKLSFTQFRTILEMLKQIAKHQNSLVDFIQRIKEIDMIANSAKKNTSSTQLLTMHSSKGLEFNQVLLIDIDKGIIPSQKTKDDDPKQWEEERRLLYVAMSRAKNNLEILQLNFWENKLIKHSPFIDEFKDSSSTKIIPAPNDTNSKNKKTSISYKDLEVGNIVKHTHFGKGTVMQIEDNKISIKFDRGIKTLSLSICESQKLLRF